MKMQVLSVPAAIAIFAIIGGCISKVAVSDSCFENLPSGWKVEKSFVASAIQTADISQKLGVPVKRVSNTYLVVEGQPVQVNILDADNAADAVKLHAAIAKMKGDPAACVLSGSRVFEYVGDRTLTTDVIKKVSAQLGI